MTPRLRLSLLTILATLPASAGQAQSFAQYPEARIEPYYVRGATPAEIYASINRNSPGVIRPGQRAHAYARSQFSWRLRPNGAYCEAEVTLDLSVVFPQHIDPDGLGTDAWTWWQSYIQALEMHEAGHLQIAYNTYPELLAALENGSCETANARGDAVLRDLGRRQDLYDQMTGHGAQTSQAFAN